MTIEHFTPEELTSMAARCQITAINCKTFGDMPSHDIELLRGKMLLQAARDAEDAERYRWLRDKSNPNVCAFYLSVGMALQGVRFEAQTVDSFIDSSRPEVMP